jgi:hypothetical protein
MSNRAAPVAIISMAQHARPKVTGQGEFRRAQLKIKSNDVVTTPGSNRPSSTLIRKLLYLQTG